MTKDLLVLADEYAAATATFARALALKDSADSMSPIAREAGDKRAVLAEALAALDTAQPVQVNAMLVEALNACHIALYYIRETSGIWMSAEGIAEQALTAAKQAQPESSCARQSMAPNSGICGRCGTGSCTYVASPPNPPVQAQPEREIQKLFLPAGLFPDACKFDADGSPSFFSKESADKFAAGKLDVPCKGKNCGSLNGWMHSVECRAEHEAACATHQDGIKQGGQHE